MLRNRISILGALRERAGQRRPIRSLRASFSDSSLADVSRDVERAEQMISDLTNLLQSIRAAKLAPPAVYDYAVIDDPDSD